jgi:hypothetical protein
VLSLVLVLAAVSAIGQKDASIPARGGHVTSVAMVLPSPPGGFPRPEKHATLRSDRSSSVSEDANNDELDGDDDDPIAVPFRALVLETVSFESCLTDPGIESAPTWVVSPSSSFLLRAPLRC